MYRQDKQSNSGGMITYVSKNIPSTTVNMNSCNNEIECMPIELNCKGTKILVLGMYKNPKMKPNDFKCSFKKLDLYEHIVIIGDLNFNMLQNNVLSQMCPTLNLTNIITEPTCHKSNTATLIDSCNASNEKKKVHHGLFFKCWN